LPWIHSTNVHGRSCLVFLKLIGILPLLSTSEAPAIIGRGSS
jgi:hypothetical protein